MLGVGLGVPSDAEYAAFGELADPQRHAALLDEGLEVLDALWSGDVVNRAGDFHRLDGVRFLPRPVQQPRVPIWSAASLPARAGIRRAARWDGVAPIYADGAELRPVTPDELAGIVAEIDRRRDRGDRFDVVVWVVAPDNERRAAYEQAGATWLIDGPAPGADWLDDATAIATEGRPAD